MGTPEFAVASLKRLVEEGYNIVAVVTTPDKPAGRGQRMHESDVKVAARELGLPILQPEKLRDPKFVQTMQELQPDLGIVIAFRMLPEVIWAMPRYGTFNLHASLLPQYRGAAPINWAIINGEKETGITTIFVTHDQEEALTMSDTIVIMSDGSIQQIGTPKELYFKPQNLFVAGFIGDPQMNFINGQVKGDTFVADDGYVFKLEGYNKDILAKAEEPTFLLDFVEKFEKFSMDSFFVHTLFIFMYYT